MVLRSVIVDTQHHLLKVISTGHDPCGPRRVPHQGGETDQGRTNGNNCHGEDIKSRAETFDKIILYKRAAGIATSALIAIRAHLKKHANRKARPHERNDEQRGQ